MKDKNILLVEDSDDDVTLTMEALKDIKIKNKTIVARDGEEALNYIFCKGEYAERDPLDLPTVVLLDVKLPKIDGIEVLRQIRENKNTKYIPVVMLTSSKEDLDLINGYKLGCNSYVRKPIEFEAFMEAVRTLGLYWLLINEKPIMGND